MMFFSFLSAASRPLLAATAILGLTFPAFGTGYAAPKLCSWSPSSNWTVNALASTRDNYYAAGQARDGATPLKSGFGYGGGSGDAFFAQLDQAGTIETGGYIGGSGEDLATDIAVSETGQVAIVGRTDSEDFPVTPGAPFEGNGFIVILVDGHAVYAARFQLSQGDTPKVASDDSGGFLASFPGTETTVLIHAFAIGPDWRAAVGSTAGRVKKLGAVGEFGYVLADFPNSTRLQEYRLTDFGGERTGYREYRFATDFAINRERRELAIIGPGGSLSIPNDLNQPKNGVITNGGDGDVSHDSSPLPPTQPPTQPPGSNALPATVKLAAGNRLFFLPERIISDANGNWLVYGGGNLVELSSSQSHFVEGPVKALSANSNGVLVAQDRSILFLDFNPAVSKGEDDGKAR